MQGVTKGVEPLPPGSQPGVQRPLHHGHQIKLSRQNSSTRIRTRNTSFEARDDLRFTIELVRGPKPVSGPAGESNPDLLVASQASSHWTSSPVWFFVLGF
jgi:hypothetical protein